MTILGDPGADSGGEGKSKQAGKYGTKKCKEQREEPLGKMSYQTSSKQSPPFCLLIRQKNTKFSGTNQKPEGWRPFGTGLVLKTLSPGALLAILYISSCHIFLPFRLFLAPTICPWVSEDDARQFKEQNESIAKLFG